MAKKLRIVAFIIFMLGCITLVITADEPLDVYKDRPMPPLVLNGVNGQEISTASWALETNGVKIINLFATWCGPCEREMPVLVEFAKETSIPIFGIAWRDSPEDVTQWLAKHGNPFKEVGIDKAFTFMFDLGITGVPTTLLLDSTQRIRYIHEGVVTVEDMKKIFLPKIEALQAEQAI